MEEFRKLVWCS